MGFFFMLAFSLASFSQVSTKHLCNHLIITIRKAMHVPPGPVFVPLLRYSLPLKHFSTERPTYPHQHSVHLAPAPWGFNSPPSIRRHPSLSITFPCCNTHGTLTVWDCLVPPLIHFILSFFTSPHPPLWNEFSMKTTARHCDEWMNERTNAISTLSE